MVTYIGKTMTATDSASVVRAVSCEKCQTDYYYIATRMGTGSGESPYFLNNKGASRRAEDRAQKDTARLIDRAIEPAVCPSCGHLQSLMIRVLRKRRYPGRPALKKVMLILAVPFGLVAVVAFFESTLLMAASLGAIASLLVVTPLVMTARTLLKRLALNPNDMHLGQKRSLPGCVASLVPQSPTPGDPPDDDTPLEIAQPAEPIVDANWVQFSLLKTDFPNACCMCNGTAETTVTPPFSVGEERPLPACHACVRAYRRWFIPRSLLAALLGLTVSMGIGLLYPGNLIGKLLVGGMLGMFISGFAAALIPGFFAPYGLRLTDTPSCQVRIRLANDGYRDAVIQAVRESI